MLSHLHQNLPPYRRIYICASNQSSYNYIRQIVADIANHIRKQRWNESYKLSKWQEEQIYMVKKDTEKGDEFFLTRESIKML